MGMLLQLDEMQSHDTLSNVQFRLMHGKKKDEPEGKDNSSALISGDLIAIMLIFV